MTIARNIIIFLQLDKKSVMTRVKIKTFLQFDKKNYKSH